MKKILLMMAIYLALSMMSGAQVVHAGGSTLLLLRKLVRQLEISLVGRKRAWNKQMPMGGRNTRMLSAKKIPLEPRAIDLSVRLMTLERECAIALGSIVLQFSDTLREITSSGEINDPHAVSHHNYNWLVAKLKKKAESSLLAIDEAASHAVALARSHNIMENSVLDCIDHIREMHICARAHVNIIKAFLLMVPQCCLSFLQRYSNVW